MIASVHLVDTNVVKTVARRTPKPASVLGLRWARKVFCGQFSPGAAPDVQFRRGGFVAWWSDDTALDAFEADHRLATPYADGWSVRLRPTRTRAQWPGADFDPLPGGDERHEGVHAAVTLGEAHPRSAVRFLRTSSAIEDQFSEDPGGRWGIGFTMLPRTVMSLTFWNDQDATDAYVRRGAHAAAMRDHYDFSTDTHEFVAPGGFFGFQPYAMNGVLGGKNPTPPDLIG